MPLSASELSTLSRLLDDGLTLAPGQLEGWLANLAENVFVGHDALVPGWTRSTFVR